MYNIFNVLSCFKKNWLKITFGIKAFKVLIEIIISFILPVINVDFNKNVPVIYYNNNTIVPYKVLSSLQI